jgi:hypothetical protein
MGNPLPTQRYTLRITYFQEEGLARQAAHLIYQSTSPTLVASISALPYTVGRTFSYTELTDLHSKLKEVGIGHRFESADGSSQVISFHPGDKKKIEEISKTREKHRKRKNVFWIVPILIASLAAVAALFQLTRKSKSEEMIVERVKLAQVILVDSKVQRKAQGELSWRDLKESDWLYEGDSVRTFERARVAVAYQEGSTILVRENSLVIIEKPKSTARELNLEDGALQARLKPGSSPFEIRINTSEGVVALKSPASGSESAIQTSVRSGRLAIAVESGQARVETKSQSFDLGQKQQLRVFESAPAKIEPMAPSIQVLQPTPNQTWSKPPYEFAIAPVAGASSYRWIFGATEDLSSRLLEQQSTDPRLKLQFLDPGSIFWKVETEIDGILHHSDLQRVYVQ